MLCVKVLSNLKSEPSVCWDALRNKWRQANLVAKQIEIISYTKVVDGSGTSPLGALDLPVDKNVEPGNGSLSGELNAHSVIPWWRCT
jgi:hypothetical protein